MRGAKQLVTKALGPLYPLAREGMWRAARWVPGLALDERVQRDAQEFWNPGDTKSDRWQANSHWRSGGRFAGDEKRWLELGRQHVRLYDTFARALGAPDHVDRMVEWGCGGGANAVAFAPRCKTFYGVDVSDASLTECARQMAELAPGTTFVPALVPVTEPEKISALITDPVQLFLCTYVFELIPSQEYGRRLLRIAHQLLAPSGMAIVQIRYSTDSWRTLPRRFGYSKDAPNMTSYRIEEFWRASQEAGFQPALVKLVPYDELVHDDRYAYFCLQRT